VLSIALAIVTRVQQNGGKFGIVTSMCCALAKARAAVKNGTMSKSVDLNDKFCYR
jgi:2-methylcitrate dehydratase PrpD